LRTKKATEQRITLIQQFARFSFSSLRGSTV